jgi:ATP-binding cassette subfamily B protein
MVRSVLARSWRLDRVVTVIVSLLVLGQFAALAMTGLALRAVVDAAVHGAIRQLVVACVVAAAGLGVGWVGMYALVMLRSDLTDRIGYLEIDPEVQRITATRDGLDHLDRSEYVDRLGLLVGKGQVLADACWGLIEAIALFGQIAVTLVLLATVHPGLLLLGVFALPGTLLGARGARAVRKATMASAETARLERHLHDVTTSAAAGKEIRVYGVAPTLIDRAGQVWQETSAVQLGGRVRAAGYSAAASAIFIVGYAAVLVFVVSLVSEGSRSIADLVLVVTLAGQLRFSFDFGMYKIGEVQAGLALVEPYQWLVRHATDAARPAAAARPAPQRLRDGIALRGVCFQYPGNDRAVLGPVDVDLPAGAMVALVGEYGSGKTTLVKLLCKFYRPTAGTILVDGEPIENLDTASWRAATTAAFQDFNRYQVRLRHAVGFGDLPAADDDERVLAAIEQAGGLSLHSGLPEGLDTQLGILFDNGRELSEGQWQKTALGRACMREAPVLVVLDEPTASLDPPSEHAIFQRHAQFARETGARYGTVTVVVSHRFSTVRMADLILVLAGGQIVERGNHRDLMAIGGTYAHLYGLQETAYRATG